MRNHSIICLPFEGFYHSKYDQALDHEIEQTAEYMADESEGEESQWPETLRFEASDLTDRIFQHGQFSKAYELIARHYVDAFNSVVAEALEFKRNERVSFWSWAENKRVHKWQETDSLGLKFESMDSPREYNFTTDRVYAHIPNTVIRALYKRCKAEKFATLESVIKKRFTSYDGFLSHYRNELSKWPSDVLEWDHNQLQTLLLAVMKMAGCDYESSKIDWRIYEAVDSGNAEFGEALDAAMDWPKFESELLSDRAEKLVAWLESDREAALAWRYGHADKFESLVAANPSEFSAMPEIEGLPYRCHETPDLFDGAIAGVVS